MDDDFVVADGCGPSRVSVEGRSRHSDMKYAKVRLNTFKTWPKQMRPCKYELASAGFVYTGESDRVRCFHCNVTIHNWEIDDDAWKEHFKWGENCEFLRMCYTSDKKASDLI